jgi:hypothetical protein
MEDKYSIFVTQGGLGKQIVSTSVAHVIKNNYPDRKLIVVSSYPEVYINNPYVERVYRLGNTPYFYKDYVNNKDSIIFSGEPYYTTSHIHKRKHLIASWCDMFKLTYNEEAPALYFNQLERDLAFRKYSRTDKPVCILQTAGGVFGGDKPYSWPRDLPPSQIQEIVNRLKDKYYIYHIARSSAYKLNDTHYLAEIPKRELLSLLLVSSKRILIDSCLQHAAAALNLPSTVCWVGTSSVTFGYNLHKNIKVTAEKDLDHLTDAFLFDYDFNGNEVEYPYSTNQLFNIDEVIN